MLIIFLFLEVLLHPLPNRFGHYWQYLVSCLCFQASHLFFLKSSITILKSVFTHLFYIRNLIIPLWCDSAGSASHAGEFLHLICDFWLWTDFPWNTICENSWRPGLKWHYFRQDLYMASVCVLGGNQPGSTLNSWHEDFWTSSRQSIQLASTWRSALLMF